MSSTYNVASLVSIGITTKNRWQDLQLTLRKIKEFGLGDLSIWLVDDHSDKSYDLSIASLGLNYCGFERMTDSKGYIVRRNELARQMSTKYYLSLDDDSYPVAGSLQKAVEFAEKCPDLFCLSFPIFNPALAEYQNPSLFNEPYKVRFFVGCGHLLHIERFLQLGGYREELIHQGEEMEIAVRAFQRGWYCYHFPGLQIHHNASVVGRNWRRMDFYGSRNIVLWADWFVPNNLKWYKQVRIFLSRLILVSQLHRLDTLRGEIAGLREIPRFKNYRQNMSLPTYQEWQSLPIY